ncbi:hypothetical protein [Gemmata sp.]|uniref:hypothetical protein n=1 Tax=Gemmata sp. TaxID=1914242 RepID=UPI003F6F2E1C
MTRAEVRRELGHAPRAKGPRTDCYLSGSFQVSFGADRVEYVEVASSIEETVLFDSVDVFDTPAEQLLAALGQRDTADLLLSRPPNQYLFPGLILTLWGRSAQYDHRGGRTRPVFAAVGLGSAAYLAALRAIRA